MATTSIQVLLDLDCALAVWNWVYVGGEGVIMRRFDLVAVLSLEFGFCWWSVSDAEEGLVWFWFAIRFMLMESGEWGGAFDLMPVVGFSLEFGLHW